MSNNGNAQENSGSKMHKRSRSGMHNLQVSGIIESESDAEIVQDVLLVASAERNVTRDIPRVRLASISPLNVNISDRCGGAVRSKEGFKRSESRTKSSRPSPSRGVDHNRVCGLF